VRHACHGDSQLQREVASLLENHKEASDFKPWAAAAAAGLIADRDSLQPGQCLGPYRIERFLAAGGMGEVYRATDTGLGRDVALKILPEGFANNPERRARFENEARAASALNHPGIVTVYDIGHENGLAYLVTEFIDGASLRQSRPEGLRRQLDVAAQT